MDYLLSLCNKSVDVIEKKALFFSELNKYHIEYDEVNKIPIRVHIFEDETKKKEYIDRNFSFFDFSDDYLNFIEGLRNKLDAKNFSESKHVFLTRTEKILAKAKERNNLVNGVRLAFSLEYVITFLWFNLNKGFGVTELKSLDIFLKSKKIYAGFFADKKMQLIQDAENAYKNREFTKEQVYEVIALFKEKSTRPEDITSESLDEMDGLSNQSINQILESHELQKQNTQKQIDSLKESNEKKDKQLNQNSEIIQAKQQEIKALEKKIADNKEYAELGKKVQPLIDGIKYIKKIISLIAIWVLLPVVVTVGAAYVLKFFQNEDKLNWEFICSNSSSLIITFLVTEAIPLWIACVKKWKKNKK